MPKRLVWADNDKVFLGPHLLRLQFEGYEVERTFTITKAEQKLRSDKFSLIILDCMMPVTPSEEDAYSAKETNFGKKTGLVFYHRWKEWLASRNVTVLIFTIREDSAIQSKFMNEGLPSRNFMTKSEGKRPTVLVARVRELMEE